MSAANNAVVRRLISERRYPVSNSVEYPVITGSELLTKRNLQKSTKETLQ